ncbi:hypothetical protein [Paracoccus sp. (in: a-proteobacteria)]|uniref:hypothetical protein n=1 Tax=Paracoccus sp. TaxID=267 RepID=UPI003A85A6FD
MTESAQQRPGRTRRILALLGSNWAVTVLGGLLVVFLTPIIAGFANLTFSMKSWELFGASNEAGMPGASLAPDSVYRLPLGERFRVEGDLLLSVYWDSEYPYASLTNASGRVYRDHISVARSLSAAGNCRHVAVHLMRQPNDADQEFFIMYTAQPVESDECRSVWSHLFG